MQALQRSSSKLPSTSNSNKQIGFYPPGSGMSPSAPRPGARPGGPAAAVAADGIGAGLRQLAVAFVAFEAGCLDKKPRPGLRPI